MKTAYRSNIKLAINSLRSTRWRSFFTMLGVIIGVTSVIAVVSIGEGVKQQIRVQIDHLGRDLITVRAGRIPDASQLLGSLNIGSVSTAGTLSAQDLSLVQRTPHVNLAVPLSVVSGPLRGDKGLVTNPLVMGTNSELPEALNQTVAYGSFFEPDDDGENVAVLGSSIARRMFDENVPLGRSFSFMGAQFVVRGIMTEFDTPPLAFDTDFNDTIFIPEATAQQITKNNQRLYEVLVKPASATQTNALAASLNKKLLAAHGGQSDFSVIKQNQSLATTNSILDLLTRLVAGLAAISILVGGIGIMNVMLLTVNERMHEIGIRKAIGATNRQIRNEFMVEAVILSLAGGAVGIVLSYVLSIGLRLFTNLQPVITWQVVVLATVISVLVGIVFGTIPAIKAARKNPIDALRNQ